LYSITNPSGTEAAKNVNLILEDSPTSILNCDDDLIPPGPI